MTRRKKGRGKVNRLVIAEIIATIVVVMAVVFKAKTNNIFLPDLSIMIPVSIVGLIFLGLGIWFEKF
jgi:hypothetical protein